MGEWLMIVKSDELRWSLSEIDRLLQSLHAADAHDEIALKEIEVLERSRQSIASLLDARQRQICQQVVSLQAWRDGIPVVPPFDAERYVTRARVNCPRPGAPRPFRIS